MITEVEIKTAFENVKPIGFPIHDKNWKILFEAYNELNDKKLGMGCRPCFVKVYYFFKTYFQSEKS